MFSFSRRHGTLVVGGFLDSGTAARAPLRTGREVRTKESVVDQLKRPDCHARSLVLFSIAAAYIYIYIDIGEASGERRVTRGGVSWSYSACLVGIAEKHASTIACFHSLHCPRHPGPCLSDCLEAPGTLRDDGSAGLFHFSCVVLATSHFSLRKLVGL